MGGELAPAPVSYGALTRRAAQEICEAENGYLSEGTTPKKLKKTVIGRRPCGVFLPSCNFWLRDQRYFRLTVMSWQDR